MDDLKTRGIFNSRLFIQSTFVRKLSISRTNLCKNHYEVLGLSESCSQEEIREAFVTKSKELHPDKNKNSRENHGLIIAVNEAYAVLSKSHTRAQYDLELKYNSSRNVILETSAPFNNVIFRNKNYKNHAPYYGIKGVQKLPNSYIALGVVFVTCLGSFFYYCLAKMSADRGYEKVRKKSHLANDIYKKVRLSASQNSNEFQMALLQKQSLNNHDEDEEV